MDRFDDGRTVFLGVVVRVLGKLLLGEVVRAGFDGKGPTMRLLEERVVVGRGLGAGVLDFRSGAVRVEVPREDFGRLREGLVFKEDEGTGRVFEVARRGVGVDCLVMGKEGRVGKFGATRAGVRIGFL